MENIQKRKHISLKVEGSSKVERSEISIRSWEHGAWSSTVDWAAGQICLVFTIGPLEVRFKQTMPDVDKTALFSVRGT